MATINIRARVTLPYTTGLATDVAINDFTYTGDDQTTDPLDLQAAIDAFYNLENTAPGHQRPVCEYLSEQLSRATDAVRLDMFEHGVAGPPFYSGSFTLGANNGTGQFPSEVAAVLSFHGDYANQNSEARARRRGRVYLGPLDRISGELVGQGYRVSQQFINDVLAAADEYLDAAAFNTGFTWAVWSPTNAAAYNLFEASMDNAFDTLRSRGISATARTVVDLTD